jgi:hypothetical protein
MLRLQCPDFILQAFLFDHAESLVLRHLLVTKNSSLLLHLVHSARSVQRRISVSPNLSQFLINLSELVVQVLHSCLLLLILFSHVL